MDKKHSKVYLVLKLLGVLAVFALAVWVSLGIKDNETVKSVVESFGYWGVIFLGFIGGFNVIVPIPVISFLPIFQEAGLTTTLVILSISLGTVIGDSVGYLLGRTGKRIIMAHNRPAWLVRFEAWSARFPMGFPIFLFAYASVAPLPNELVVIPAAMSGHKWWRIVPPLFLGNLVLNTLIARGIIGLFL